MTTESFMVYFITDKAGCKSELMKTAFSLIRYRRFQPQWITDITVTNKSIPISSDPSTLYVVQHFDGRVYEMLLGSGARIISPYVILYCGSGKTTSLTSPNRLPKMCDSIPLRRNPVYSQCMRSILVTCSDLDPASKQSIEEKVKQMSGFYLSNLTYDTKYLISNSVLTKKYQAAAERRIPVMKPEWIDMCWEKYQFNLIPADDPKIVSRYTLPIFHGLTITISQINLEERNRIAKLIVQHGGTYSPSLRLNVPATILLLREKSGEKYINAKKKQIPRLRIEWLHESIRLKYAMNIENYSIDSNENVNDDLNNNSNRFENINVEDQSDVVTSITSTEKKPTMKNKQNLVDKLNQLAASCDRESCFFENVVLFSIGFEADEIIAIRNVARHCGALVVSEFKPKMVTHVILEPAAVAKSSSHSDISEQIRNLREKSHHANIVTIDWLLESFKMSECVDCTPYRYDDLMLNQELNILNSSLNCRSKISEISDFQIHKKEKEIVKNQRDITSNPSSAIMKNNSIPLKINTTSNRESDTESPHLRNEYSGSTSLDENNKNVDNIIKNDYLGSYSDRSSSEKRNSTDDDNESLILPMKKPRNQKSNLLLSEEEDVNEIIDYEKIDKKSAIKDSSDEFNGDTLDVATNDKENTTDQKSTSISSKSNISTSSNLNEEILGKSPASSPSSSPSSSPASTASSKPVLLMFSGFENQRKESMSCSVMEKLGVNVLDDSSVTEAVTHLILHEPYATEKTLSAIAAGMWILKPEYIEDSLKAGRLLPEIDYAWGLDSQQKRSSSLSKDKSFSIRQRVILAAKVWHEYFVFSGKRAFQDWPPILVLNKCSATASSVKILEAGGAQIFNIDDFVGREAELKSLLPQFKLALFDKKFERQPPFSQRRFLAIAKYLVGKDKVVQQEFISRYIIDGRPLRNEVSQKYLIDYETIAKAVRDIYHQ